MRTSNNKRWYLSLTALLGAVLCLNAQSFQESFYLRNYALAYRYNPAIVRDNGFISLGQVSASSQCNVGASSFLFPTDDGLVTGLHSSIPSEIFPGTLPENIRYRGSLNAGIFAYGFRKGNTFHTFELNARSIYGVSVPRQLFELVKLGTGSGTLGLGEFRVDADLFAELAYGYSRRLNDWLSLGARAKLLLPVCGALVDINRLSLTASEEELAIGYDGELYLTNRTFHLKTEDEASSDVPSKRSKLGILPSGAGLAVDLGLVATPAEGLTLSLSVLDLGGIYWYYGNRSATSGPIMFEGLENVGYENLNANYLKDWLVETAKGYLEIMKPVSRSDRWRWQSMPLEANLGVKYEMPFYRRLAVGATGRYLANAGLPYGEGRFGLEVNPLDWLDLTANVGYGSLGAVWGVAGAVKMGHFRLTAGLQSGFGGTIPRKIVPLAPHFKSFSFGLSYDL